MKAKCHHNQSCASTINYIFDAKQHGGTESEFIGGTVVGRIPKVIRKEFDAIRQQRMDIGKPAFHVSLSLPPGDSMTAQQWRQVVREYMQDMGIDPDKAQWVAVRHKDKAHQHIHLLVNRIGIVDGKIWDYHDSARRSIDICRRLELQHPDFLRDTSCRDGTDLTFRPTQAEDIVSALRGTDCMRGMINGYIKTVLDEAAARGEKLTATKFAKLLRAQSAMTLDIKANISASGKMSGFSFSLFGHPYKASDVNRRFRWAELSQHIDYQPERDNVFLAHLVGAQVSAKPKIAPSTGILAGGKEPKAAQSVRIVKNPVLVKKRKSVIDDDVLHHNRRQFRAPEDEPIKTQEQQPKEPEAPMLQDGQTEQGQQEPGLNYYGADDWER